MDSEALRTELPRLLAAATALFAGVTAAMAIRSLVRRGDGGGVRRSVAAMVAGSVALAFGAGFLVYSARIGYASPHALVYAASGFGVGLLAGLYPLFAGVPLFFLAAVLSVAVVSSVAPTKDWVGGEQAARLTVYSATDAGTVCGASLGKPGALAMSRDFPLPPGPIALEMGIFDIRGPFSAVFGRRRYHLYAIIVGDSRTALGEDGMLQPMPQALIGVLRLAGCAYRVSASPEFMPEDMLSATIVLEGDGGIRVELR
jgi:hypothetical protein